MRGITRVMLLALSLAAATSRGAPAQEVPGREESLPAAVRALIERAAPAEGPVPPGPSVALLDVLHGAGLLILASGDPDAYLTCPPAPVMRVLTWPDLPAADDCDLTTPAVEAYVAKLLDNADACLAYAQASYDAAVAAKAGLDAQVDVLPTSASSPVPVAPVQWDDAEFDLPGPHEVGFTQWLVTMTEAAKELCDSAGAPFDAMAAACEELNGVLSVQQGTLHDEGQRADFHERLDDALVEAAAAYGVVNERYALLVADAQAFLDGFSEDAACPDRGGEVSGAPERARALAAFRASLREAQRFELALRLREVHVFLWVEGRLVILTAPSFVAARLLNGAEPTR